MGKVRRAWESYLALWERLTGAKKILFCLFHYTLLFLTAFLLAYSPFLLSGKSFIAGDGRNQHYPALIYVGRYLRQIVLNLLHGKVEIPLFDLSLAMGGDVIATLNYYGFGNPLYLLSALVPTHYTEYLYNALIMVRLYLAGLSFWALCAHHKKPFLHSMIGALVYVFSGFAVFSAVRHPYFIEPMIQLPLLLIGIDLVIQKKKPFIFILTVFYSALCGFYFLYMMTIMLGIYTLACFFDWYRENRIKEFFSMAGRTVGSYLLGIGLSAPLFFPAVIGFLTSGRAGETVERNYFSWGWNWYKNNLLGMIAPPGSWDTLSLAAIALLALCFLLFLTPKQYRSLKILFAVSMFFYILPLGGYIMNGFGYPSQRWTFGLALLLSYILVEMLPVLLRMKRKQRLFCFAVFLLYFFVVFLFEKNRTTYRVVGVAMLAGTLLILYLFGENGGANKIEKRMGAIVCILGVLFNVSINALYLFSKSHYNYINSFTAYGAETKRIETAIERDVQPYLDEQDGRFDSSSFLQNVGVIWHVPAVAGYWSIIVAPVVEFEEKIENAAVEAQHEIWGVSKRTGLEALCSTKYLVEKEDGVQHIPYGYSVLEHTEKGNLIYENQYALPWGYTYDGYMTAEEAEAMNGLETEEAMLQNIILEKDVNGISRGMTESQILNQEWRFSKNNQTKNS